MKRIADLHTHTTASDGQYGAEDLVRMASERGIQVLAVTDHDALDSLDAAVRAGAARGVRVLRGVELGASEDRNLHLLGYGFAPGPSPLAELCRQLQAGRDARKYRILDFLAEKGLPLTLEEVEALAGGRVIARPHFAQAMVRRGYVKDNREAFDRYLDTDEYRRIERPKESARRCIEVIRASGGHAALAHPYQLRYDDARLEALVRRLRDWGLEGLECCYPRHSAAQTALYLGWAERYGLHPTGGSDFHGEKVKPDVALAAWELDVDWLLEGT